MRFKYYSNLKKDLTSLFNKYNLLNLWNDSIKSLMVSLTFFLKNEEKSFDNKLISLSKKYNIKININDIKINKNEWIIKFKYLEKQISFIYLKYKKWNYFIEKENKFYELNNIFHNEIKKINQVKKYFFSNNKEKVLFYPIENSNYPIYNLSEEIKKYYLHQKNKKEKLNIEKLLLILKICDEKSVKNFTTFLYVYYSRIVTKINNEIIPFIENISYINFRNKISKIYYYDSPDFIVITNDEAVGVEVTNVKHKNDYYIEQCYKEHLLRKLVNPNCFYSKKYFICHKKSFFAYKQNLTEKNYKVESLSRHFSNNNKYNRVIRKNGFKVKRGQKNFYILNGWNKKENNNKLQKKLIKNIAIKENIPFNRLIFFDIDS